MKGVVEKLSTTHFDIAGILNSLLKFKNNYFNSSQMSICTKLIQLATVCNLFPFKLLQKCQRCVLRETSIVYLLTFLR